METSNSRHINLSNENLNFLQNLKKDNKLSLSQNINQILNEKRNKTLSKNYPEYISKKILNYNNKLLLELKEILNNIIFNAEYKHVTNTTEFKTTIIEAAENHVAKEIEQKILCSYYLK